MWESIAYISKYTGNLRTTVSPPPPATCCCSFTKSLLDGTGHRLLLASYIERKKQLVTTEAASLVSANYQTIWEQIEKQTSRKVMVVKYPELYLM